MAPQVVDWDGDGLKDLIVGFGDGLYYYRNIRGERGEPLLEGERYGEVDGEKYCEGWQVNIRPNEPLRTNVYGVAVGVAVDWRGLGKLDLIVTQNGYFDYYQNVREGRGKPIFIYKGRLKIDGENTNLADVLDRYSENYQAGAHAIQHATPTVATLPNGRKDLFYGSRYGTVFWFKDVRTEIRRGDEPNLGPQGYLMTRYAPMTLWQGHVQSIDWNKDGRMKLIAGEEWGEIWYYKNVGNNVAPLFSIGMKFWDERGRIKVCNDMESEVVCKDLVGVNTDHLNIVSCYSYSRPFLVDWDLDGKIDLIVGSDWGHIYYYRNMGRKADGRYYFKNCGRLRDVEGNLIKAHKRSCPIVVDWRGDGNWSIIAGGRYKHPSIPDEVMVDERGDTGRNVLLYESRERDPKTNEPILMPGKFLTADEKTISVDLGYIYPVGVMDWDKDGENELVLFQIKGFTLLIYKGQGGKLANGLTLYESISLSKYLILDKNTSNRLEQVHDATFGYLRDDEGGIFLTGESNLVYYISLSYLRELINNDFVEVKVEKIETNHK